LSRHSTKCLYGCCGSPNKDQILSKPFDSHCIQKIVGKKMIDRTAFFGIPFIAIAILVGQAQGAASPECLAGI